MIYELRTYQVVPGKMKNLNDRFANITLPLFEKHGMKVIGFWETAIGEATTTELIYMLAFEDRPPSSVHGGCIAHLIR